MSEEKKDLLKDAKKIGKKVTKGKRMLTDDELEEVAGGFWETEGWAAGYWVQCPKCGADLKSSFKTYIADMTYQVDGFECQTPGCGCVFGVDSSGDYWL